MMDTLLGLCSPGCFGCSLVSSIISGHQESPQDGAGVMVFFVLGV